MGVLLQFVNCKILRNNKLIKEDIWVRNGKIVNPENIFYDEKVQANRKIDCQGHILAPGYIDVQINGGFGVDFSYNIEKVEEGIHLVAKGLLKYGVTSFCPTIVTSHPETYHKLLPKICRTSGGKHGATVLGIHVEGPFISMEKKGAHKPDFIRDFDKCFDSVLEVYGDISNVSIVTLAPEKENAYEVIKKFTEKGIVVSLGHSMANLSIGEKAVEYGASFITHLFNAMLPFHHRDPGLVGLLASSSIPKGRTVYFGIISDGVHTNPAALRIAYRAHPEGLVLVSDAISAFGLKEGQHNIGEMVVEVKDSKAYIAGTNTLCGSIASLDECVRFLLKATECSKEYALEVASLHPALALGIDKRKGTLNFGADADFVILDDDLNVISTWIAAECVYEQSI